MDKLRGFNIGGLTPDQIDAIDKAHDQNTDTSLDHGGANAVTAAELKRNLTEHALGNISGAVTIDADDGKVQVGTVNGDITGFTFNNLTGKPIFLQLDNAEETHAITSADSTANEFEVTGNVTHKLKVGSDFPVADSNANDGDYEVTAISFDEGDNKTVIGVASVADDTDDGNITIGGYSLEVDVDYRLGELPPPGIFAVYFYQQGSDVYAVISEPFNEV